jgi:tryptophan 2-monooxygenase
MKVSNQTADKQPIVDGAGTDPAKVGVAKTQGPAAASQPAFAVPPLGAAPRSQGGAVVPRRPSLPTVASKVTLRNEAFGQPVESAPPLRPSSRQPPRMLAGDSSPSPKPNPGPPRDGWPFSTQVGNHPTLDNTGRMLPPVTPQTLGRAMHPSGVVGQWPQARLELAKSVVANLQALDSAKDDLAPHLEDELTLHWHALSDAEKVEVLDAVASSTGANASAGGSATRPVDAQAPPVAPKMQEWLGRSVLVMRDDLQVTLKASVKPATRAALATVFDPGESLKKSLDPGQMLNNNALENLYNYKSFLEVNTVIGTLPDEAKNKSIAIVGAGPAGLAAARELIRAGVTNLKVIEQSDRVGGRLHARSLANLPSGDPSPALAEMGAMRFPPSMEIFTHYAKELGLEFEKSFPNPGTVPTRVLFKGDVIELEPGKEIDHPLLGPMAKQWHRMEQSIVEPMMTARRANDTGKMQELWQEHIDKYQGMTLQQGVKALAKDNGFEWGPEQLDAFGAVGVGTGGYRPFFNVGFTDALRVMLNNLETDQQWLPKGTSDAMRKFVTVPVKRADGEEVSIESLGALRLNTEVMNVASHDGKPSLTMKTADGKEHVEQFDAVVFSGGPRNAEFANIPLSADRSSDRIVDMNVAKALQETHMAAASKCFIEVPPFPDDIKTRVILTDQPGQMTYTLQYPEAPNPMVLLSYTWEQQAHRLDALSDQELLAMLKTQIAKVDPAFAEHLQPVEGSQIGRVSWQQTKVHGAFALQMPNQMKVTNDAWKQFQSVLPEDPQPNSGVYIANDAYHHGGWVGPALRGGINAACAAFKQVGGELADNSPLTQSTDLYDITPKT